MKHCILFTGHLIDTPGRPHPRFPPSKELAAKLKIKEWLAAEKSSGRFELTGIASGACGGDILFHESCAEIGIPTAVYLAAPPDLFKIDSVSFAGKEWDKRFDDLMKKLPVQVLTDAIHNDTGVNIWERTNRWLLEIAMAHGPENMTLLALWDGKKGDGKGGTEHMINEAKKIHARTVIISLNDL